MEQTPPSEGPPPADEGDGPSEGSPSPDENPAPPNERPPEFRYHLELTPPQLKITHTALHSLLDDFGHEESDVLRIIHEVLDKLPDEHAIRAIRIGEKADRATERRLSRGDDEGPRGPGGGPGPAGPAGEPPAAA